MPNHDPFQALGLPPALTETLAALGYQRPSAIQVAAIPPLLAGQDLLAQAQTGSGKTAAFALPLLARLRLDQQQVQALVLVPTRELAQQVSSALQAYASRLPTVRVLALYGGAELAPQLAALRQGVQLVVGTPGRVMDHLRRNSLDLSALQTLVLDEADDMLKMGFQEDVQWIMDYLPSHRQTVCLSATLPPEVQHWAQAYLRQPLRLQLPPDAIEATVIQQRYWLLKAQNKPLALAQLLTRHAYDAALCFVRTRDSADQLAQHLRQQGLAASSLHGDMAQRERDAVVESLRDGRLSLVVATDVAARGLDVARISLVVNYDPANDADTYVHRIGRTGRAGRVGEAVSLLTSQERECLPSLEQATGQAMTPYRLPSAHQLMAEREQQLQQRLALADARCDRSFYQPLVARLLAALPPAQTDDPAASERLAATLLSMLVAQQQLQFSDVEDLTLSEPSRQSVMQGVQARALTMPGRRKPGTEPVIKLAKPTQQTKKSKQAKQSKRSSKR